MRFGLIYAAPGLYNLVLWALYRTRPRERFAVVAKEVTEGDVVVDLCAGTSLLYEALAKKKVDYRAFDINPGFIDALKEKGVQAHCCDIESMEIPEADVVTMSSALYHFYPRCAKLVERMRASARKKVVLVEPVRNNADSGFFFWGAFAQWMSKVDDRAVPFHFDEASLNRLLDCLDVPVIERRVICEGRDMFAVLSGARPSGDSRS
jgi:ubiquinone/menaquinone biosynthesis C-methylase UbiE